MEFAQSAHHKVIMNSNAVHFFDKFAIFLSATCAIHCLLTPILIVFLPIIGTTFFADANFHLWMLYLVIPTTAIAIFLGCKKHKDKIVITLSALGLLIVTVSTIYQYSLQADSGDCVICMSGGHSIANPLVWVNILAGAFLISAHVRNYKLCRADNCKH